MSEENVETYKRALDAINRRDIDAVLEELDPGVEWHDAFALMTEGEATVYRGREGVRAMFGGLYEAFASIARKDSEIRDLHPKQRLVAIGVVRARGKESGVEIESPICTVLDFEQGKVIRVRYFLESKEAFEAAGLSE